MKEIEKTYQVTREMQRGRSNCMGAMNELLSPATKAGAPSTVLDTLDDNTCSQVRLYLLLR